MAPRTSPPFRADHVGSLLRPPELLRAREDLKEGRIDADELRGIEDEAIRDVVRKQEEVGLQSATDGEFRRASWHMDFIYQLGGIDHAADNITVQFRNAEGTIEFTPAALHVEERVALREPIFADDFRFVQDCVTTATPKLTIPSPSMVHYRGGRAAVNEDVYPDMDEFWSDLRRPTPTRSRRSAISAAPTCSSTTPASPTSTTPSSAHTSPSWAATPSTSTRPTSATSTRLSKGGPRA